jgi:Tfp pilus assembly major pilin PilA
MTDAYMADEAAVKQGTTDQPAIVESVVFQPMPEQDPAGQTAIEDPNTDNNADKQETIKEIMLEEDASDYSIEQLIEEIIATQNEDEDEDFTFEQDLAEETKEGQAAHEQHRFPNVFTWIPDGWSKYVIILVLIFFIWLVSPIAFIIGLIALYLWFKCDGDSCSIC